LQPYKKCKPPQIEEDQIVLYAAVEGRTSKGFAKTGSFKHIFPKSGKLSKSYTNHYSRALSAGSSIITWTILQRSTSSKSD
jgi:hypothetical protein